MTSAIDNSCRNKFFFLIVSRNVTYNSTKTIATLLEVCHSYYMVLFRLIPYLKMNVSINLLRSLPHCYRGDRYTRASDLAAGILLYTLITSRNFKSFVSFAFLIHLNCENNIENRQCDVPIVKLDIELIVISFLRATEGRRRLDITE